jgi:hypothetical protein
MNQQDDAIAYITGSSSAAIVAPTENGIVLDHHQIGSDIYAVVLGFEDAEGNVHFRWLWRMGENPSLLMLSGMSRVLSQISGALFQQGMRSAKGKFQAFYQHFGWQVMN